MYEANQEAEKFFHDTIKILSRLFHEKSKTLNLLLVKSQQIRFRGTCYMKRTKKLKGHSMTHFKLEAPIRLESTVEKSKFKVLHYFLLRKKTFELFQICLDNMDSSWAQKVLPFPDQASTLIL